MPTTSCAPRSSSSWVALRAQIWIFKLWSRWGSIDCVTEVGREDPVRGGTVITNFDMGVHRPFVVYRQQQPGTRDGAREVLACNAYFVSEFDR